MCFLRWCRKRCYNVDMLRTARKRSSELPADVLQSTRAKLLIQFCPTKHTFNGLLHNYVRNVWPTCRDSFSGCLRRVLQTDVHNLLLSREQILVSYSGDNFKVLTEVKPAGRRPVFVPRFRPPPPAASFQDKKKVSRIRGVTSQTSPSVVSPSRFSSRCRAFGFSCRPSVKFRIQEMKTGRRTHRQTHHPKTPSFLLHSSAPNV